jgi:hypothetical protein
MAHAKVKPLEPKVQRGRRANYGSTAMMAEIFMLRLEAATRAAKEAATTSSRFVPITLPAAKVS